MSIINNSINFFKTNMDKKQNKLRKLNNDINFGYKCEEDILQILNNYFKDEFKNTKNLYANEYFNYDYESEKGLRIELKSRRINYNDYDTTIIPVHKTLKLSPDIFVFNFNDGIYYIEWNFNKFKNYEIKMILSKRFDRNEYKEHYLIPINDLIKIN